MITSPWKWRHLKSVIVTSVQSPPSMLKLHDFCNRADGIVFCNMGISLVPHIDDFVMGAAQRLGPRVASEAAAAPSGVKPDIGGDRSEEHTAELLSLMRISYADFSLHKKQTVI